MKRNRWFGVTVVPDAISRRPDFNAWMLQNAEDYVPYICELEGTGRNWSFEVNEKACVLIGYDFQGELGLHRHGKTVPI